MKQIIIVGLLMFLFCGKQPEKYTVLECEVHIRNLTEKIEVSKTFIYGITTLGLIDERTKWEVRKLRAAPQDSVTVQNTQTTAQGSH